MSGLPLYLHNIKKRQSHKKVCEKKKFCKVIMTFEDTKVLELNQYQTFDKAPQCL